MNFNEAEAEIRKHFKNGWNGLTDIAYPDTAFQPSVGETFVRFNCQETSGKQVSAGSPNNNLFRHYGFVTIQVFQPEGQSSTDAREKAQTAIALFMGKNTTNGIHFYDVYGKQLGNDGKGYYQLNVTAFFRYDEIT